MTHTNHKNQSLKTFDLLLFLTLMVVSSSVVALILFQGASDDRPARAQAVAESLALQLKELNFGAGERAQPSLRSPASIGAVGPESAIEVMSGTMGRDPWGRPFSYSIRQKMGSKNRPGVVVWSMGPNGKLDSDSSQLVAIGDDILHIEQLVLENF